jgi:hypothetical protein
MWPRRIPRSQKISHSLLTIGIECCIFAAVRGGCERTLGFSTPQRLNASTPPFFFCSLKQDQLKRCAMKAPGLSLLFSNSLKEPSPPSRRRMLCRCRRISVLILALVLTDGIVHSQTAVRYEVATREFVSVKVYNLLGQEVIQLVDGFQESGLYQVAFVAGDLPSGAYFYRLRVGETALARPMILLR